MKKKRTKIIPRPLTALERLKARSARKGNWPACRTRIIDPDKGQNVIRAERGRAILRYYIDRCGEISVESAIGDLIADLLHLADAEGLDFRCILRLAIDHHRDET